MNIVLLSGGSGKRLWPLSNDIRSKQFVKIFKLEDGKYESMVQRMYRHIRTVSPSAKITIATSETQVSTLINQLGENIEISVEPCKKDTFPSIALATAYLHDVKNVSEEEAVVVCPVDPYVDIDYFKTIKKLWELAKTGKYNLNLLGIRPTYPSEKYGYIIPTSTEEISKVSEFKEKPDSEIAKRYITQGALWNGGVFAFKIKYMLDISKKLLGSSNYYELFSNYENLKKISFDYAVAEEEKNIAVMRFSGKWRDLGTWDALSESLNEHIIGEKIKIKDCKDTHVINELDIPILCIGTNNLIVSASRDGILVAEKEKSSNIKSIVDSFNYQIRFAEKSWGEYRVLEVYKNYITIKLTLFPGKMMSYHCHKLRKEIWTVLSGTGYVILDGIKQNIKPGDTITIKDGCKHTVVANTELELIEIQIGEKISNKDKIIFELE